MQLNKQQNESTTFKSVGFAAEKILLGCVYFSRFNRWVELIIIKNFKPVLIFSFTYEIILKVLINAVKNILKMFC